MWVPGHYRIEGNEKAEKLARKKAGEEVYPPTHISVILLRSANTYLNVWLT